MPRILIADDDTHVARVMRIWLERHGYEVATACDGSQALQHARDHEIDFVISDMNMPRLDGLGLVKALREMGITAPIFVLTARPDQSELTPELERYGARIYPKPFVPSRLVSDINRVLGVTTA